MEASDQKQPTVTGRGVHKLRHTDLRSNLPIFVEQQLLLQGKIRNPQRLPICHRNVIAPSRAEKQGQGLPLEFNIWHREWCHVLWWKRISPYIGYLGNERSTVSDPVTKLTKLANLTWVFCWFKYWSKDFRVKFIMKFHKIPVVNSFQSHHWYTAVQKQCHPVKLYGNLPTKQLHSHLGTLAKSVTHCFVRQGMIPLCSW